MLVHNCSGADLNYNQVQRQIAKHVTPRHGAGTASDRTKFADGLGEGDLFSGLLNRLHPSNQTGRVNARGSHQHIVDWPGAGATGEGRVEVWISSTGDLGGMWPV